MNAQLWNHNQVERGQWFQDNSPTKDSGLFEKIYGHPDTSLGTEPFQLQPPPTGKPRLEAPRLGRGVIQSMTSRYSDLDLSPPEIVDREPLQADSPVFGLNGIIRPSTGQSKMDSPEDSVTVADPDRNSDLSDLFRKQEELDNSIAALKLLGDSTDLPPTPSSKESREPSTARSDFSLSNFPRPPWVEGSDSDDLGEPPRSPSSVRTVRQPRLRYNPPSISVDNVPFDLVPPRIPAVMADHNRTLSVPISETAESDLLVSARTQRFDSQGTQYDVTSFIGSKSLGLNGTPLFSRFTDLTSDPPPPGHKKDFSGSSNATDDSEQVATIMTLQQSKQTYVGSPLSRVPVVSSTTPRILPATRVTLPSKPKLDISQPRPAVSRLRQDVSSNTFEWPRAVPSMN